MQLFNKTSLASLLLLSLSTFAQANVINLEYQLDQRYSFTESYVGDSERVTTPTVYEDVSPVSAFASFTLDLNFEFSAESGIDTTYYFSEVFEDNTHHNFGRYIRVSEYSIISPYTEELQSGMIDTDRPFNRSIGLLSGFNAVQFISSVAVNNDTGAVIPEESVEGLIIIDSNSIGVINDAGDINYSTEYGFAAFLPTNMLFENGLANQYTEAEIIDLLLTGGFTSTRVNESLSSSVYNFATASFFEDTYGYAGDGVISFEATAVASPASIAFMVLGVSTLLFWRRKSLNA